MNTLRIKKGDQVQIISGKDRGKTGAVLKVFVKEGRVSIEGINMYKKRLRPRRQNQKGEVVEVARPLNASNVMPVCGNCKKPTRVGFRAVGDRRTRYCKKCDASL